MAALRHLNRALNHQSIPAEIAHSIQLPAAHGQPVLEVRLAKHVATYGRCMHLSGLDFAFVGASEKLAVETEVCCWPCADGGRCAEDCWFEGVFPDRHCRRVGPYVPGTVTGRRFVDGTKYVGDLLIEMVRHQVMHSRIGSLNGHDMLGRFRRLRLWGAWFRPRPFLYVDTHKHSLVIR